MQHSFKSKLFKDGNRTFIKIPFNVWDKCGQKGLIPIKVSVDTIFFECKLIPKGNGIYYIPVPKAIMGKIPDQQNLDISFEVISGLSRINHDSPYSKENPIRKIDSITSLIQSKGGLCGQCCIAMLAGVSIEEVTRIMNCDAWNISWGKILETLDYYGIRYADKMIYTRGKEVILPECCIVSERMETCNHFLLHYHGTYYDSVLGKLELYDKSKMIGYLEISIK
jgi:hypothetical protein